MTQTPSPAPTGLRARLRESRLLILFELAAVAAIFVADIYGDGLILISKTLYLLPLAWLSMWVRGVRWRDVGLQLGPNGGKLMLLGLAVGLAMSALELQVTQPLLVQLTGEHPDLSDFKPVVGNLALLALFLGLGWTLAAFGEEMVHRGYILQRLADLIGRGAGGWVVSLVVMSVAFGLAHVYQGPTGVIENTLNGLLLGGLYLATGRNLTAPIVAHGVTDTIDFVLIYLGRYPGL